MTKKIILGCWNSELRQQLQQNIRTIIERTQNFQEIQVGRLNRYLKEHRPLKLYKLPTKPIENKTSTTETCTYENTKNDRLSIEYIHNP